MRYFKSSTGPGSRVIFIGLVLIALAAMVVQTSFSSTEGVSASPSAPAACTLDPTFGTGGLTVTSFPLALDTANDVAVQADGKIVVAGSSGSDFALTRYNTDGNLDVTFGVGGRVNTDFPVGKGGAGTAMIIQPDGKIVVTGLASDTTGGRSVFALVRYNTSGTLDSTFDGDGRVITSFPGANASGEAIARQPDGKLVVAGTVTDTSTFNSVFGLARYNSDGSLDNTFDGDGLVTTDLPGLTFETARAIALQSDGRIVVAGQGSSAFEVVRYNSNGSLDTSFDTDGIVTTTFGGTFEEADALAIQSDGKIIVAGQTARSVAADDNFALARYNTDGSLDNTFDGDGKVTTDFGLVDGASAVVIQTDGRIVAAGRGGTIALGSFFALARYNTNGTLDNAFDGDGKVLSDFSGGRFGLGAQGVALQTDGRIVTAGDANNTGQRNFGVMRHNTDGSLDTTFGVGSRVQTDFPLNEDSVSALALQPDGKIIAAGFNRFFVRIVGTQDPNFEIARYDPDGTLDTTFGTGGLISTDFLNNSDDFANGVALQTDGRFVVVGQTGLQFSQAGNTDTSFGIARYNANGTLDSGFGTGGRVTTDFGTTHDAAFAVAIQSDGKIVVAGTTGPQFALARYNTDGTLDLAGFGAGTGKVTTDFTTGFDTASAVVIQTNGKIVVGGSAGGDFALARYNTDGSLDLAGFGSGGKVVTDFSGGSDGINELVLQPDGKIVGAGFAAVTSNNTDFALARYNTDGSLDTAGFGAGTGKVTTDISGNGFDQAASLARQSDGKLVAAGLSFPAASSAAPEGAQPQGAAPQVQQFALTRYNPDGSLDAGFGTSGRITSDFFGIGSGATAVVIQPDGKIVAGGFSDTGSSSDFALARYGCIVGSIQFAQATSSVTEDVTLTTLTVTRTGDTSAVASVDFATSDGSAIQRTDYTLRAGTVKFAVGETSKTLNLLISEDAYVEGNESLTITLSNPTGNTTIGTPGTNTLTIIDDDTTNPPVVNPIDDANIFVRQHYHDFLSREGDPSGIAYWTGEITRCGTDAQCLRQRRLGVSDAFFFEMEFQITGSWLYRVYVASFGTVPLYNNYMPDRSRLIGGPSLGMRRSDFLDLFTQRTSFISQYPLTLTPGDYVDMLNANTGNSLSATQRDALVAGLQGGTESRATVLGKIGDNASFIDREYNKSFVLSLYFDYLRRDAEAGGFDFWLAQINAAPIRNVAKQQALVCSFISAPEYQNRFSSVVTHTMAECPQ